MHRYKRGLSRKVAGLALRARIMGKQIRGLFTGYPVYRPWVDHSVYAIDNARLGSTLRSRANIVHQVSIGGSLASRAVVEFEHAFALLGHLDERTDYVAFREHLPQAAKRLRAMLDLSRHRLVAASHGARRSLLDLDVFSEVELGLIPVVRWATIAHSRSPHAERRQLEVFHFGGQHPIAKGTHDVLEVARLLPDVRFHLSVELSHPAVANSPSNVDLHPFWSRSQYLRALRCSDVMLSPLYSDGWGVYLDALAFGLPIVCYDTYDKREAVEHGQTGFVISAPKELSFYDSFLSGRYQCWSQYQEHVLTGRDSNRVARLADALVIYASQPGLLAEHSMGAMTRRAAKHDPKSRLSMLRAIYDELSTVSVPSQRAERFDGQYRGGGEP
jgi:hypothetical protein